MKKITLFLLSLFSLSVLGQTIQDFDNCVPNGYKYQGVARDSNGSYLNNQSIIIRFSIIPESNQSTILYQETHSTTTNDFGLFNVVIGQGTNTSIGLLNDFSEIEWKQGPHLLNLQIDIGNGLINLGNEYFWSVPYAMVAKEVCDTSTSMTFHNTLDMAYDEGLAPGAGRLINANAGAVKIDMLGAVPINDGALNIQTRGLGEGIMIDNTNDNNGIQIGTLSGISGTGAGLDINHSGVGDGIEILHTDDGDGIYMVHYGDGDGMFMIHYGDGHGIGIDQIGSGDGVFVNKTDVVGHAGNFYISNITNDEPALQGGTEGTEAGVYGYYMNPPTSLAPNQLAQPFKAGGVVGQSFNTDDGQANSTKQRVGVAGGSKNSSGVYGRHLGNVSGTYSTGESSKIVAGVLGRTPALNTADNWGVAGIGDGYGSGVLGIGWYENGIGVLGVSGDQADHMTAGVWGIARESTLSNVVATWPLQPHPDINSFPKQEVGVLGQADDRVAIWGESLQHIGVVGTAGGRFGFSSTTVDAGIFAKGEGSDTYGLYAESKGYYGIHGVSEADSTFTTAGVKAEGMGDRDKAAALELKNGAIRVTGANKPAGSRTKVCSFMMNPPVFASPNFMSSQQNTPEFHGDHMIAGSDTIHISNALIDANRSLVFLTIGSVANLIPIMNQPPVTVNITSQSNGEIIATVWAFGNPLDLGQVSITLNYFIINE